MDKITIERIGKAHPDIRVDLLNDYLEINKQLPEGVRLRFTSVYRSNSEQDILFNQKPKVTNAKGGQSIHNYGLAFDIVILIDEDKNGTFEKAVWNGKYFDFVVEKLKGKGYEWGGDWKRFKDNPHFQVKKSDGSSWSWRELANKKTLIVNEIKYPIL